MLHFTIRDMLWLTVVGVLAAAWWWDRSGLAMNLRNCRYVLEQQRQTINELSGKAAADNSSP